MNGPEGLNAKGLGVVDFSIVVRTYNEDRYLDELLRAVADQELDGASYEVVLVDSGSTDSTLAIARSHCCRVVEISKDEFTFGRSLNIGCAAAKGSYLAFVSGHCVPASNRWLLNLTKPLREGYSAYAYGNQIGRDTTKFSEQKVFEKYFDPVTRVEQPPYFVNNANAALCKSVWLHDQFDEKITGLEDMHLAKALLRHGLKIAYATDAPVFHIHDETWMQIKWRFEREALALQEIDPSLHMSRRDLVRCILSSIYFDWREAINESVLLNQWWQIVAFRTCQYWGSYLGSRSSRKITTEMKKRYFYPDRK